MFQSAVEATEKAEETYIVKLPLLDYLVFCFSGALVLRGPCRRFIVNNVPLCGGM